MHSIAVITTNITSSQAQDLACTFVKWFYEMINGFCKESSSEFRPDHFFADADAKIAIQASASDASQPGNHFNVQCTTGGCPIAIWSEIWVGLL